MFGADIIENLLNAGLIEESEEIETVDYNNMPLRISNNEYYDIQGVYHNETSAIIVLIPLLI